MHNKVISNNFTICKIFTILVQPYIMWLNVSLFLDISPTQLSDKNFTAAQNRC